MNGPKDTPLKLQKALSHTFKATTKGKVPILWNERLAEFINSDFPEFLK